MLHMAIKTINKHFMSLDRSASAHRIGHGSDEMQSGRRGTPSAALLAALPRNLQRLWNQKGVAMNGEDDGCHEASRCGKLRARIHQICSRPTSASTRCPTDQTYARRSPPFSPDASICHVNHVVQFNLILFIDVVRALNRLRCCERALCWFSRGTCSITSLSLILRAWFVVVGIDLHKRFSTPLRKCFHPTRLLSRPSGDAIIGTINKHSINIVENKGRHFPLGRHNERRSSRRRRREKTIRT